MASFTRKPDGDEKVVEILIGSDVPEAHWIFEQRRGKEKKPYAVQTLLGWTLEPMNCFQYVRRPQSTSLATTKKRYPDS